MQTFEKNIQNNRLALPLWEIMNLTLQISSKNKSRKRSQIHVKLRANSIQGKFSPGIIWGKCTILKNNKIYYDLLRLNDYFL